MPEAKGDLRQFEAKLEVRPIQYRQLRLSDLLKRISSALKKPPLISHPDLYNKSSTKLSPGERYVYDYLNAHIIQGRETEKKLKQSSWEEKDFSLEKTIKSTTGPVIEVAGPTERGYHLIKPGELKNLEKPVFTSNIKKDDSAYKGSEKRDYGRINFQADVKHLPLADQSVGTLFCSDMEMFSTQEALEEVTRVIEPNGLFIFQGITGIDIKQLMESGFRLKKYQRRFEPETKIWFFDGICQKET